MAVHRRGKGGGGIFAVRGPFMPAGSIAAPPEWLFMASPATGSATL